MSDNLKQETLFEMKNETQTGPVTCLGLTFENDDARRAYFTEELRKKLPELKGIKGFPKGDDEDILTLSDPPYYTACPNPWVNDFILGWEKCKEMNDAFDFQREPFTADVSEGKSHPIYNAHSYHTKVPHKAIMRYILHYTNPGDVVFDGFCGSGMTGVAAEMCGNREAVRELGYQVDNEGWVLKEEIKEDGKVSWVPFSKLGPRRAILNDLSSAATFISYNYNTPVDIAAFEKEAIKLLSEVEKEFGWMYETKHIDGQVGRINYTVWSDVFVCPECTSEIVFRDVAVDYDSGNVKDEFACPFCTRTLTKRSMERAWTTRYDSLIGQNVREAKQIPVLINYTVGGKKAEKKPDEFDLKLIEKINNCEIPYWVPTNELKDGQNTRQPKISHGVTHIHHFYTKRNLMALGALYSAAFKSKSKLCVFFVQYAALGFSKLSRYSPNHFSQVNRYLSGTLYIGSQQSEVSVSYILSNKFTRLSNNEAVLFPKTRSSVIGCGDSSIIEIKPNSVDYIFVDPPFGANLNYSELNSIWESWLKVSTDDEPEAIENSVQGKNLNDYRQLMLDCFKKAYSILKPGRWMTVEFSNTKASVWNSIQTALVESGFIVANVSALDKKQGSFKAVTTTTAVKQDLVISAYKPSNEMKSEIIKNQYTEDSAWSYVRNHLEKLPIYIGPRGITELIVERTPRVLFDRMVSYYVQNGLSVPLSSAEFQTGVERRFPMRDGMAFLERQVVDYDKKRMSGRGVSQLSLFVSDENSAIEWLRHQLLKKPQTRQELHSSFIKEIQHIAKHEMLPELDTLLEQNFLKYEGESEVPSQIHTYLSSDYKDLRNLSKKDDKLVEKALDRWYVPDPNKQADLEKLREKTLLREFSQYIEELSSNKKKLKQFRTEAIRAGFKKAWSEKDYQTIVTIGERLPENVLQEDDKLLMYYDNAQIRLGL
ncbi:DNA methyltransferase [Paenibacillus sp. GCM10023250]|uniref:DNA methyltransferase n=1 Tax=Paenibacillus sp. GCM10023250 TaxID=3252648 RepID=UPI003621A2B6